MTAMKVVINGSCFVLIAARGRGRARGGTARGWTPGGGAPPPGRGRAGPQ